MEEESNKEKHTYLNEVPSAFLCDLEESIAGYVLYSIVSFMHNIQTVCSPQSSRTSSVPCMCV